MDTWKRSVVNVLTLSTLLASGMGLWLWLRRRRKPVPLPVSSEVMTNCVKKHDIRVITTVQQWDNCITQLLSQNGEESRVLGIDCEWVVDRPVALLQIASSSGFCVLVRLGSVGLTSIPPSLQNLLADKRILKLGVSVDQDAKKLLKDYGLKVNGCVDLRNVLARVQGIFKCRNRGLQGLAKSVLNVNLCKDTNVRCSNWEAEHLSAKQIKYAAMDALVAVDIFTYLVVAKVIRLDPRLSSQLASAVTKGKFLSTIQSLCQGIVDAGFVNRVDMDTTHGHHKEPYCVQQGGRRRKMTEKKQNGDMYSARRRPLWDNCELLAPDGQVLCTCDSRKAAWYISKGLGNKVGDNPLTVRLRFEPSGRPKSDRHYYLQQKENVCVVCGSTENYARKYIVPQEYRKYFPLLLKEHTSHDVLLMCPPCHRRSSDFDGLLRSQLAKECQAPLNSGEHCSVHQDHFLQQVRSAGRALKMKRKQIPEARVKELEDILRHFFGVLDITAELLESAASLDVREVQDNYVSHAQQVVEYMAEKTGLLHFQARWRRHFMDTMNPQHLPAFWSVDYVPENWSDRMDDGSDRDGEDLTENEEIEEETDDEESWEDD